MKIAVGLAISAAVVLVAGYGAYEHFKKQAELAVDQAVDRELARADLAFLVPAVSAGGADRLGTLRGLYQRRELRRGLNDHYGQLVARWGQIYPRLARRARFSPNPVDEPRLAVEVDERLAAGAFAAMQDEFETFQREESARAARQEQFRREADRAIDEYIRRTGRLPPTGSRIEAGRIVEPSR